MSNDTANYGPDEYIAQQKKIRAWCGLNLLGKPREVVRCVLLGRTNHRPDRQTSVSVYTKPGDPVQVAQGHFTVFKFTSVCALYA